ncbi:MAG: T9SS type A sorting domain-containing protein, partial [Bacteroidota bacterium]
ARPLSSVCRENTTLMLIRNLLLFFCFAFGSGLIACNCIVEHIPLRDVFCYQDTSGGAVVELVLLRKDAQTGGGTFRVNNVHIGTYEESEIILRGGSSASCGWSLGDQDLPGNRFLYFIPAGFDPGPTDGLFECGFVSNVYRLDRRGRRIEYGQESNGRNVGLAYQPLYPALTDYGCGTEEKEGPQPNPLRKFFLADNPGSGEIVIRHPEAEHPDIDRIEVFDAAGRSVRTVLPDPAAPLTPFHLRELSSGLYFVRLHGVGYRKTMRYLKVG